MIRREGKKPKGKKKAVPTVSACDGGGGDGAMVMV
jgi:hypothetical protein